MVHIQEIVGLMGDNDFYTFFYDKSQDKVVSFSNYEDFDLETLDPHVYYCLPDRHYINDYENMRDFIDTLEDDEAAEWLSNAIRGRGAFRMFRATLDRFHLTGEWYDFREEAHQRTAIRWCEENGLEYDFDQFEEDDEDGFDDDEWLHGEKNRQPVKATAPSFDKQLHIVEITKKNAASMIYMMQDYRLQEGRKDDAMDAIEMYLQDHEKYSMYAVMDKGQSIAYMIMHEEPDAFYLDEIFVKEKERRQKIGSQLLKTGEELADENGKSFRIHVSPKQLEAIAFLNACGYKTTTYIELVKSDE